MFTEDWLFWQQGFYPSSATLSYPLEIMPKTILSNRKFSLNFGEMANKTLSTDDNVRLIFIRTA